MCLLCCTNYYSIWQDRWITILICRNFDTSNECACIFCCNCIGSDLFQLIFPIQASSCVFFFPFLEIRLLEARLSRNDWWTCGEKYIWDWNFSFRCQLNVLVTPRGLHLWWNSARYMLHLYVKFSWLIMNYFSIMC